MVLIKTTYRKQNALYSIFIDLNIYIDLGLRPRSINIHYIHSMLVQDFVSGRACCVNQYHYESWKRRVVMRFVHATGKTWYKVLYQHTMYVISLSNISIKTSFKQITRVKLKLIYYSDGDYISCMTSRYFVVHSTMPRYCVFSHIPMIRRHD
jgi:hypothetical protein